VRALFGMGTLLIAVLALSSCASGEGDVTHVLLVSLDTTRADYVGLREGPGSTPNLNRLAAQGLHFSQAYTTVPSTLAAHTSILSGLYPAQHGVHQNARYVPPDLELLAPILRRAGFRTSAFVSGYPLAAEFGLGRGFDHYDDRFKSGANERNAEETTSAALAYLAGLKGPKSFTWVHYFDPHDPYQQWPGFEAEHPYRSEIAYMDHHLGRLVQGFRLSCGEEPHLIVVVGDHGEGLGEHGERLHGNLLYQGTVRVPLILAGHGIEPGDREGPVTGCRRGNDAADAVVLLVQAWSSRRIDSTSTVWSPTPPAGSVLGSAHRRDCRRGVPGELLQGTALAQQSGRERPSPGPG